jgi:hypothetical protein
LAIIELGRRRHLAAVCEHAEYFVAIYDEAAFLLQRVRKGDVTRHTKADEYKSSPILGDPATYTGGDRLLGFQYLDALGSIVSSSVCAVGSAANNGTRDCPLVPLDLVTRRAVLNGSLGLWWKVDADHVGDICYVLVKARPPL